MKKLTFYLFAVFALMLFNNVKVQACSCVSFGDETVAKQVARAKKDARAVFSGRILEVVSNPEKYQITVKIKAEKSWKGTVPRLVTLTTASDSGLCGYNFEVGKSYLIYAQGTSAKDLQTNLCTRTAEIAVAKADLRALGKGKIPRS